MGSLLFDWLSNFGRESRRAGCLQVLTHSRGLNNRMTAGEHPTDYFHGEAHERTISARYEELRFSSSQVFKAMQLEAYTRGEDLLGSGRPQRATPHLLQALVLGDIADKKERAEQAFAAGSELPDMPHSDY